MGSESRKDNLASTSQYKSNNMWNFRNKIKFRESELNKIVTRLVSVKGFVIENS